MLRQIYLYKMWFDLSLQKCTLTSISLVANNYRIMIYKFTFKHKSDGYSLKKIENCRGDPDGSILVAVNIIMYLDQSLLIITKFKASNIWELYIRSTVGVLTKYQQRKLIIANNYSHHLKNQGPVKTNLEQERINQKYCVHALHTRCISVTAFLWLTNYFNK